jgi:hypothetical protein
LQSERDALAAALGESRTRGEALDAQVAELTSSLDNTRQSAARKQAQLESEAREALDDAAQRHRDELARALRQHADEIARLQAAHAQAAAQAAAAHADVTRALQALQYRFDHREPRSEDVARIRELESYALAAEKAKRQAQEELKYYKLELLNREENFNKTFGRSPSVAPPPSVSPPVGLSAAPSGVSLAGSSKGGTGLSVRTGGGAGGHSTRALGAASAAAASSSGSPGVGFTSSSSGGSRKTSAGPSASAGTAMMMAPSPSNKALHAAEEEKSAARPKRGQ